ncbi:MAG: hypothetical protein LBU35_01640 [Holosporales bacterium]|jgi:diaminopimelate epimerase|nr:hypothetical protein [Holosporales bacterium]
MRFVKTHTNGNDFVITMDQVDINKIKLMSDRRFGIGCDQFVFISDISCGNYNIEFFNQDGSKVEMCGNGACAAVLYIKRFLNKALSKFCLFISGIEYRASIDNNTVSIEFPMPLLLESFGNIKVVSTGNKHLLYETDIESIPRDTIDDLRYKYPDCNIHFLNRISHNVVRIKTFERGVGWTKSCGSGAVAVAFSIGCLNNTIKIIHEGGESNVIINSDSLLFQSTPTIVFKGEIYE